MSKIVFKTSQLWTYVLSVNALNCFDLHLFHQKKCVCAFKFRGALRYSSAVVKGLIIHLELILSLIYYYLFIIY